MNERKIRFGTDGIRGEVGREILPTDAFTLGACLNEIYGRRLRICVGMDTRLSSPMLAAALISGLLSSGCEVHTLGVLPTPAIAYLTDKLGFDMGIAVTASHNPFVDNGIKLFLGGGEKLGAPAEMRVEEYLSGKRISACASGIGVGRVYNEECAVSEYLDFLASRFGRIGQGLKVGLDTANGAAYKTARSVLEAVGCRVTAIGDKPNGININGKVGSLHPEALANAVISERLDMGFCLDGDGDRCIAVGSDGHVIDGDGILYALAKRKRAEGVLKNSTVAATVTSNGALAHALALEGIALAVTPVGDKELFARMTKDAISLGAESSGHLIDTDIFPIGDGTATALSLIRAVAESGNGISSLVSGFSPYPSAMRSVDVSDKNSALLSDAVTEAKMHAEELLGENGRLLLRASGTENKIRILAECPDADRCKTAVEIIEKALRVSSG